MVQMIDMKKINVINDIDDIPDAWVYKHYAEKYNKQINQPFDGRLIKISSFRNRDTNPSLCFYYNSKRRKYLWKDYSSGIGGDAIDFVAYLESKSFGVSLQLLIAEYEKFLKDGGDTDKYEYDREVVDRKVHYEATRREWRPPIDEQVWYPFKIGLETIVRYKVAPLDTYDLVINGININHVSQSYGYYSKDYGLYQIYQPFNSSAKYLNNKCDYIIGSDQLEYKSKNLGIVSGLKDIMAITEVGLDTEFIAGKSESSIINHKHIEYFKSRYENIFTMLDNDKTGINSMKNYQKIYKIPMVHINLEKDLADNNKRHNLNYLKAHYTMAIDKQINKDG